MQEKKDIGSMAEKYKAEMMRIYNSNKPSAAADHQKMPQIERNADIGCESCAEHTENFAAPPITGIPYENVTEEVCKFPTAEELIKRTATAAETAQQLKQCLNVSERALPIRGSIRKEAQKIICRAITISIPMMNQPMKHTAVIHRK